ncbi:hypothetical protein GCM10007423_11360 [Dyadobacter endophyticus]|uniref:CHRD domain-containing protein n=1 Tax=Dyadobacter endophyticus TaxID=1749036 RepID=A0ABQ1YI60_9BACT|nr:hypothetical protein [Dyadobacter endophyticus]GGH26409.1 hypothetical protein GCM10007423_11360 [Dyadobacter endophyticus]
MKTYISKVTPMLSLVITMTLFALLSSCEQQDYPPNLSTAPGGGTVSTYKAYTLAAANTENIYGRVVFYKYNKTITLVQMGLYNGVKGSSYTAAIFPGKVTAAPGTALKVLDTVAGATGAFATSKYFSINEEGFFDKLDAYNANVTVKLGTVVVAAGNIGANAAPVAESE